MVNELQIVRDEGIRMREEGWSGVAYGEPTMIPGVSGLWSMFPFGHQIAVGTSVVYDSTGVVA